MNHLQRAEAAGIVRSKENLPRFHPRSWGYRGFHDECGPAVTVVDIGGFPHVHCTNCRILRDMGTVGFKLAIAEEQGEQVVPEAAVA